VKFTDGFWQTRPGVRPLFAQQAYDIVAGEHSLTVTAPTKVIQGRGDTLNRPVLTVTLSSPLPNIVGVRIEHFQGLREERGFDLVGAEAAFARYVDAQGDDPDGWRRLLFCRLRLGLTAQARNRNVERRSLRWPGKQTHGDDHQQK